MHNIQVDIEVITPAMASEFLTQKTYDRQRSLKRRNMDRLIHAMENDTFGASSVLHIAKLNGKEHVLNGQHRLSALRDTGREQSFVVIRETVLTSLELNLLYSRFDRHSPRTARDMIIALGLPQELGLSVQHCTKALTAWKLINSKFHHPRPIFVSDDAMVRSLRDYSGAIKSFVQLLPLAPNSQTKQQLQRASTLSLAMVTFQEAPESIRFEAVEQFWRDVISGENLQRISPAYYAFLHHQNTRVKFGIFKGRARAGRGISIVSPQYASRYLAKCWNAYHLGETMEQSFRISSETSKVVLDHTTSFGNEE